MKRIIALILCAAMLLPALNRMTASADSKVNTEAELVAFLQNSRGRQEAEIILSADLYRRVSADDFALMRRLEIKGGISDCTIYYRENMNQVILKELKFDPLVYRECRTESDVLEACRRMQEADVQMLCTPEYSAVLRGGDAIYNAAALSGYESISVRYDGTGIIYVEPLGKFDRNRFAAVENITQLNAALKHFSENNVTDFCIAYTSDLFDRITDSDEASRLFHAATILDRYSYTSYESYKYLHYYGVEYTENPKFICKTERDIVDVISQMGAAGKTTFTLVFSDALKDLMADDFYKRLDRLEAQAGMYAYDTMTYGNDYSYITYINAGIAANVTKLSTAGEAMEYIRRKVADGEREIHLFCTENLYSYLMEEQSLGTSRRKQSLPLHDLASNSGIYLYSWSDKDYLHYISIEVEQLYPGTQILYNRRSSGKFPLSAEEKRLLEKAEQIVSGCMASTETQTARNIHDAICNLVTYEDKGGKSKNDTAIGALLYGRADCDGYADAFCLLAGLAGLEVRFQRGASRMDADSAHMWNMVKIDGTWRMVDVTFDDTGVDEKDGFCTLWFNNGADLADRVHFWYKELSVRLDSKTDPSCRMKNEFYVQSPEDIPEAVEAAAREKLPTARIVLMNTPSEDDVLKAAEDAFKKKVTDTYYYGWDQNMFMFTASHLKY